VGRVNNLNKYRKAKKIVKDLEQILKIVDSTNFQLSKYKIYRPVSQLCDTIEVSRDLLVYNLEFYRMIVETKGEVTGLDEI